MTATQRENAGDSITNTARCISMKAYTDSLAAQALLPLRCLFQ